MESPTAKELREVLEMFGIEKGEVIDGWVLQGHLMDVCMKHHERETIRKTQLYSHE